MKVTEAADRSARQALLGKYQHLLTVNSALSRSLVSYQSNRTRPYYRWFKYKEGFSAALVEYMLARFRIRTGVLLDPFAGSGAALLVGRDHGLDSMGIELLPVGVFTLEARLAAEHVRAREWAEELDQVSKGSWRVPAQPEQSYRHLRITKGAFPPQAQIELDQFRAYLATRERCTDVRKLLDFACLSILEAISYTRKDGQYLRWDERAARERKGQRFHKGAIPTFSAALCRQMRLMLEDMQAPSLFSAEPTGDGRVSLSQGSCLQMLPGIPSRSVDIIVTSPPYCNRYDYTRTYALELAYLGVTEQRMRELRQELLSCTVENRSKVESLREQYYQRGAAESFHRAERAFAAQEALHEVLRFLETQARKGILNNTNVPRMVRNYFVESSLVIGEMARVLKREGRVVMVNDNVQYAGEEIPVDLLLCSLAEEAGLTTEYIWVLERGKGNSSQQMGRHGRNELRKCAYVWRNP